MMSKKAKAQIFSYFIAFLIGGVVITVIILIMTNGSAIYRSILKVSPFELNDQQKCEAKDHNFWCDNADLDDGSVGGRCLESAKAATSGAFCDPKNYKGYSYNDICRSNCRVSICPGGQGRVDGKCKSCKTLGQSCGGGVFGIGSSGDCCSDSFRCDVSFVTSGKCIAK